jgi:hypothetical protein
VIRVWTDAMLVRGRSDVQGQPDSALHVPCPKAFCSKDFAVILPSYLICPWIWPPPPRTCPCSSMPCLPRRLHVADKRGPTQEGPVWVAQNH